MLATMIAPWSLSIALILVAASFNVVVASNLWGHNQEVVTNDQQHIKACVFGPSKKYDQWTIHYHEVKPSSQFPSQFILDPAWVERHQTVGDTDVSAISSIVLKRIPLSNTASISLLVPPGCHGPRTDASIPATRERTVFLLPDIRVRSLY